MNLHSRRFSSFDMPPLTEGAETRAHALEATPV